MVYILGWIGSFLASGLPMRKGRKFFGFIVLLYCFLLAFFRGDVGTDTANYVSIFKDISIGKEAAFSEPGFKVLAAVLIGVFSDADIAVKLVSVVFFAFLFAYLLRANRNESFLFLAYLLPVFVYSYSMNGLRIGLAFSIFIVLFQDFIRSSFSHKRFLVFAIPVFFHISALAYPVFIYLYRVGFLSKRFVLGALFFGLSLLLLGYNQYDYLWQKLNLYSNYSSPGAFSGVRIVISLLVILLGCALGRLALATKGKLILLSLFFILSGFMLVQYSYAGLRVLDLLACIVPLAILWAYQKDQISFDKNIKISFLMAALLQVGLSYYGYLNEAGSGVSPFLPYAIKHW